MLAAVVCLATFLGPLPTQATAGTAFALPKAGPIPPVASSHAPQPSAIRASAAITTYTYLPLIYAPDVCGSIAGEQYSALSVSPPKTDRPAEAHADLNLSLRSYRSTSGTAGLIDLDGGSDPAAPQLPGLFSDDRTPIFRSLYQVYDWNWTTNSRGNAITDPPVTLAGLSTTPGEIIRAPSSGYTIGNERMIPERGVALGSGGYSVLVLYAASDRITLKYTREDNVVVGYTLHVEKICVEPTLLALYQSWNDAGRGSLPALKSGQGIGRASGVEIGVAVRDCGTFMDPRSRKDWWQGR